MLQLIQKNSPGVQHYLWDMDSLEGEGILDQCKYHIRTTLSKRSILHESGFFVRKGELMSHGF
jgi:hypothetical protein